MKPVELNPSEKNPASSQPEVFACLNRGGTVVTANARAARALRHEYAGLQRSEGKAAWQTPAIFDWESWLEVLWKEYLLNNPDAPLLLSQVQELAVWEKIVPDIAGSESIAALASSAWRLLSEYRAHDERSPSWERWASRDAQAFQKWAAAFERQCDRHNWMSRNDLPTVLGSSIEELALILSKEFFLVGFDRTTPAQQRLIDAIQAAGSIVRYPESCSRAENLEFVSADDLRDELTTCAWWARRRLESGEGTRIAILVEDLSNLRGEIGRTFRSILKPESVGIVSSQELPFEFSLGHPLSHTPVVKAALLLLRWLDRPIEQAAASWLMMSGFFSAANENLAEMAALDAAMRKYGKLPPEITFEAFAAFRSRVSSTSGDAFMSRIKSLYRKTALEFSPTRKKTVPEWLDSADAALRQLHWPGQSIDSLTYQAIRRWERLTNDLAGLEFDGSRVPYSAFVTMLVRYANEAVFAPESRNAPIQIMGAFESSGQRFDALWFLGADDGHWPSAFSPHPLLPLSTQRRAGMPHASNQADWQLFSQATERISASAPICVFSYAQRNAEGASRPSTLLRENFGTAFLSISSAEIRARLQLPLSTAHECQTEAFEDDSLVPWLRDLTPGGADVLKNQSACAFRAFSIHRLGARALDEANRGLSPLDRGDILHKVLDQLWSKNNPDEIRLRGREDLVNARANGRISAILRGHIEKVFDDRTGSYKLDRWMRRYLEVEQDRLYLLLSQWLDYEIARTPFNVVEHEKKLEAEVNGLKLNLRVDRVDEIGSGRLILDYKTGKVATSLWQGERPDEPQLPVYATYGAVDDLQGVMFAQIRAGEVRFFGHVTNDTVTVTNVEKHQKALGKIFLDESLLGEWSDALCELAEHFLRGDAVVAPKSYPKTCKYCDLGPLCRVAETAVAVESREDEMPGNGEAAFGDSDD